MAPPRKPRQPPPEAFCYSPVGWDPSNYPGIIAERPEAALWFLTAIYTNRLTRKYDDDHFINLSSLSLGLIMGDQNYVNPVKKALIEHGLIETDGHYLDGEKCIGFRLGPALRGAEWEKYRSHSKRFIRRFEHFKRMVNPANRFSLPVHYYLESWVRRVVIPGDADLARAYAQILAKKGKVKENTARNQADFIRIGFTPRCSACRYGRFHSILTGLCKELRPYLTINGQRLCEIDVVNSQPYFLALVLIEQFAGDLRRADALDLCPPDLRNFAKETTGGGFYETLMEEGGPPRDEVKPLVFKILYGPEGLMQHSELTEVFKETFPSVFYKVIDMKRNPPEGEKAYYQKKYKNKPKFYKWVGGALQKKESEVIIRGLCERLRVEYPDVPILTVHDSLMTTPQHQQLVHSLMVEEFRTRFPLIPQFRITPALSEQTRLLLRATA